MKTFEQMTFSEKIEYIEKIRGHLTHHSGLDWSGREMIVELLPWLIEECQRLRAAVLKTGVNE